MTLRVTPFFPEMGAKDFGRGGNPDGVKGKRNWVTSDGEG